MGLEAFVIIFLVVVGVLALGSILFTGWAVMGILRLTGRTLGWLLGMPSSAAARRPMVPGPPTLRCPRPKCHATNVPAAKYCRRCGTSMAGDGWADRARPVSGWAAAPNPGWVRGPVARFPEALRGQERGRRW
ncbi:MAG: hypothetical protein JWO31_2954 [Phycisphaerales bacterium]|nr:hypothetical protein [Phycisphaerales bacterium]